MKHFRSGTTVIILFFSLLATAVHAEDYYQGKTLRFIVGSAAGGGYDAYTRMVARYMGRYLPGKPTSVVENMTGAGGLVAANYMDKRAKADGLTIGIFNNSNVFRKGLGDRRVTVRFEKLGWIGAPSVGEATCMVMGFTGTKTLDEILKSKKPLKMGANRVGSAGHDLPAILNKVAGTNFNIITGYAGTAPRRIALQARELDGFCSQWESMRVTARGMLDAPGDDKLIPFITHSRWEDPEIKNVPLFKDVIKDPKGFAIYKAWNDQMEFQRPFTVAPGTSRERLQELRTAFEMVLKDKDLLQESAKTKLIITYVSGEKTEQLVKEMLNMDADVKKNLEFLIRGKSK